MHAGEATHAWPRQTDAAAAQPKKRVQFPGAVTTLAIVTVLVWVAALFIPPGAT